MSSGERDALREAVAGTVDHLAMILDNMSLDDDVRSRLTHEVKSLCAALSKDEPVPEQWMVAKSVNAPEIYMAIRDDHQTHQMRFIGTQVECEAVVRALNEPAPNEVQPLYTEQPAGDAEEKKP